MNRRGGLRRRRGPLRDPCATLRAIAEFQGTNITALWTIPAQFLATLGAKLKIRRDLECTVGTMHLFTLYSSLPNTKLFIFPLVTTSANALAPIRFFLSAYPNNS
jgi:hypothetical protein